MIINPLTFWELVEAYKDVHSGIDVFLWSDDQDENDNDDPLLSEAVLIFDERTNIWFFEVNKESIHHLSESKKFKDYSVLDIQKKYLT
jgi:hypothetical protein